MASVTLIWTDNATNEDGFTIQRKNAHCSAPGTFADIGSVAASTGSGNTITFTDPAAPFPYACYRVRATNATEGDSGYSNEAGTVLPAQLQTHRRRHRRS
jgi:hypothetical protein